MFEELPKTAADARAQGVKYYFTGKPCPKEHVDKRVVSTQGCYECKLITTRESCKRWREKYPDRSKRIARESQARRYDKYIEYHKSWRAMNRSKVRAQSKSYYERNKEKVKAMIRDWHDKHPESRRVSVHKRNAKRREVGGSFTAEQILNLLHGQNCLCANVLCRTTLETGYHMDHIMPLCHSGHNGIENIQLLCQSCNLSKGRKLPEDWMMRNLSAMLSGVVSRLADIVTTDERITNNNGV